LLAGRISLDCDEAVDAVSGPIANLVDVMKAGTFGMSALAA